MIRGASPAWSIAASVLFVAAVLGVLIYFDTHQQVLQLLEWLLGSVSKDVAFAAACDVLLISPGGPA